MNDTPPRPSGPRIMPTLLATLATIIVVIATVGLLLNALFSQLYFASPPRGDQAMGLVIPLIITIVSGVAITIAAAMIAFKPGGTPLVLLASSPLLTGTLIVALTFGMALAAFMALIYWCEPGTLSLRLDTLRLIICWFAGIIGPLLLALGLLTAAWTSADHARATPALHTPLTVLFVAILLLSTGGYIAGAQAFAAPILRAAQGAAGNARTTLANRTIIGPSLDKLIEQDMAQMTSDTPLSRVIAFLPNSPDAIHLNRNCKQIVIQRALQVPNLNAQLNDCMRSHIDHDRYAATEFVLYVEETILAAHHQAWGDALKTGIDAAADAIARRPAWLTERFGSSAEPLAHIKHLIDAAERFKPYPAYPQLRHALQALADTTNNLNNDAHLKKLHAALSKAGYPPAPAPQPPAAP